MDINLVHRPRGATHAGKEESHGSWYKKSEAGHWMFIDMGEDGLPDRQWCVVPDSDPGYELIELPPETPSVVKAAAPKCDGGPAFPAPEAAMARFGESNPDAFLGMSLRDHFAARAMQGICAHADTWGLTTSPKIAHQAYELADAMLFARSL
ncbi:hypothetical protein [uncultured Pseudomonas sp.]|uniref:hypothetical protein n=1 Tax=uncultured Pseudomonas sp. TaxID=114707 RepID=UPI001968DC9C|nr:hypothetical protein [uncultured Pseudomonas sp.]